MTSLHNYIRFLRWHLGHTLPMIVRHPSTYPELPRKSALRRYFENLYIYIRDGEPCAAYDGLGLDIKGRKLDDFISNLYWLGFLNKELAVRGEKTGSSFQRLRNEGRTQVPLLQNKYLFWSYLERHGIPAVPVIAHSLNGELYQTHGQSTLEKMSSVFVKPADGNRGNLALRILVKNGNFYCNDHEITIEELLKKDVDYIFQPVITNHEDIRILNPTTLNTLRIVTCRTKQGNLELWGPGLLRIGRKNAVVDNFSQGGIAVGINEDGKLKEYGYYHDENFAYIKINRHPDSNLVLKNHKIPLYQEAVELTLRAHKLFPTIKTIGWDVAVTQEKPILLEGNHDCGLELFQIVHHKGARARFREIYG